MQRIFVQIDTLKEAAEGKPDAVEIVDEAHLKGDTQDRPSADVLVAVAERRYGVYEPGSSAKWLPYDKWYLSADERWRLRVHVANPCGGLLPNPDGLAWQCELLVGPINDRRRVCIAPTQSEVTLGRGRQESDIVIVDSKVSSLHARIRLARGRARVSDAGSSGGIKISGTKLHASDPHGALMDSDAVADVGQSKFKLLSPASHFALSEPGAAHPAEPLHAIPSPQDAGHSVSGVANGREPGSAPPRTEPEATDETSDLSFSIPLVDELQPLESGQEAASDTGDTQPSAGAGALEPAARAVSESDEVPDRPPATVEAGAIGSILGTSSLSALPQPERGFGTQTEPVEPDDEPAVRLYFIVIAALIILIAIGVIGFLYVTQ